eukprot:jgi/Chrzof1/11492/UNPLg00424.t1
MRRPPPGYQPTTTNTYIQQQQTTELDKLSTAQQQLQNKLYTHKSQYLHTDWQINNTNFKTNMVLYAMVAAMALVLTVCAVMGQHIPQMTGAYIAAAMCMLFIVSCILIAFNRDERRKDVWGQYYWPTPPAKQ